MPHGVLVQVQSRAPTVLKAQERFFVYDEVSDRLEFDDFSAGFGAAGDSDTSLGNFEMLREEFNQRSVGLTVVGFGAEINDELVLVSLEDFFLRGAGFYGN